MRARTFLATAALSIALATAGAPAMSALWESASPDNPAYPTSHDGIALAAVRIAGGGAGEAANPDEAMGSSDAKDSDDAKDSGRTTSDTTARPLLARQIADGTYEIDVSSSSSMFRIVQAELVVVGDSMRCTLTLSGTGYGKLYMGTSEAAERDEGAWVEYAEDSEGAYTYTVPVEALDVDVDCAAWSIRRQRWYDRTLVFHSDGVTLVAPGEGAADDSGAAGDTQAAGLLNADSQAIDTQDAGRQAEPPAGWDETDTVALADGTYLAQVTLTGGSGKASVASPCALAVEDGVATATLVWSSSNYDLMVVDGVEYEPVTLDGGSTFEIPVRALDTPLHVSAETLAMSEPHMIDYVLTFHVGDSHVGNAEAGGETGEARGESSEAGTAGDDEDSPAKERTTGGAGPKADTAGDSATREGSIPDALATRDTSLGIGASPTGTLALSHATQFAIDEYDGGLRLLTIASGEQFLLVNEGAEPPQGIDRAIQVIRLPLDNVYLAASSGACLVDALGSTEAVAFCSMRREDCSVSSFAEALGDSAMTYVGKYSAPDYELLLAAGCPLAIESTMVNHTPEVREKLQDLGIVVMTEMSSYEPSPLGRLEWIKLYGALLGRDDEAGRIFDEQVEMVEEVAASEALDVRVAYFYVNSNGSAVTHRPGGYVSQMVELAGGSYAFADLDQGTGASSTVTLEMEQFYAIARDADVIIYDSAIAGEPSSLADLVSRNPLLADFAAVRQGHVWCSDQNMFQQMTSTAQVIADMRHAFAQAAGEGGEDSEKDTAKSEDVSNAGVGEEAGQGTVYLHPLR